MKEKLWNANYIKVMTTNFLSSGSGMVVVIFSKTALISFFINSRPPCMSSLVCPF